jgi:hypothetical protein
VVFAPQLLQRLLAFPAPRLRRFELAGDLLAMLAQGLIDGLDPRRQGAEAGELRRKLLELSVVLSDEVLGGFDLG